MEFEWDENKRLKTLRERKIAVRLTQRHIHRGLLLLLLMCSAWARADSTIYYVHPDHLGTPHALTDQSGQVVCGGRTMRHLDSWCSRVAVLCSRSVFRDSMLIWKLQSKESESLIPATAWHAGVQYSFLVASAAHLNQFNILFEQLIHEY